MEYHYQVPFDTVYDYLGESVRDDLEDLFMRDTSYILDITVKFESSQEELVLHLEVPKETVYDYVGESLRVFIETPFCNHNSNMEVHIKITAM